MARPVNTLTFLLGDVFWGACDASSPADLILLCNGDPWDRWIPAVRQLSARTFSLQRPSTGKCC